MKEQIVNIRFKEVGVKSFDIPVSVIYEVKRKQIVIDSAFAALPAFSWINELLNLTELKLLVKGYKQ